MAKKTHFRGVGKEKIHTAREGTCKEFGNCNYAVNANSAPADPPWCKDPQARQAHHVLCVSSTIGYKSDKKYKGEVRTIDAVYKNTRWCVNQKENMLWLPLKGTYLAKRNNKDSKSGQPGTIWKMNLPCHEWDHNCTGGYTDEVKTAFKSRIWDKIVQQKDKTPCFDEDKTLKALEKLEKDFRRELKERGTRTVSKGDGTKAALLSEGTTEWWLPFSMAKDNIAAGRPAAGISFAFEVPKNLRRIAP